MRTTPEQRATLRATYTPEPPPVCRRCGGQMAMLGSPDDDRIVCWHCPTPYHPYRYTRAGNPEIVALLDDVEELLAREPDAAVVGRGPARAVRYRKEELIDG